jgi:hypothetical protein
VATTQALAAYKTLLWEATCNTRHSGPASHDQLLQLKVDELGPQIVLQKLRLKARLGCQMMVVEFENERPKAT